MDCKTFALLLDVSPEERTEKQVQQMQQHAKECAGCAALLTLLEDCKALDMQEELPPEFTMGWRMKVRREEAMEKKRTMRQYWQRALATAAAVVFVFGGATLSYLNGWGVPAANNNTNQMVSYSRTTGGMGGDGLYLTKSTADYAVNEGAPLMEESAASTDVAQIAKIIRTVDYTIKTRAFDADYEKIQQMAAECGGRVESLSVSGDVLNGETRYAYFTLRIPSDKLEAFIGSAKTVGAATAYSEYAQDVSETYYDIEARLATQLAKLARLNELLSQATTMSDLIEIESAISDAQYQIDRYQGQLNGYDSRINYSYVYVSLREVSDAEAVELPDVSLGERIVNAVKESVRGMGEFAAAAAVFIIAALPWCAVLAVVVIVIKVIHKSAKKK